MSNATEKSYNVTLHDSSMKNVSTRTPSGCRKCQIPENTLPCSHVIFREVENMIQDIRADDGYVSKDGPKMADHVCKEETSFLTLLLTKSEVRFNSKESYLDHSAHEASAWHAQTFAPVRCSDGCAGRKGYGVAIAAANGCPAQCSLHQPLRKDDSKLAFVGTLAPKIGSLREALQTAGRCECADVNVAGRLLVDVAAAYGLIFTTGRVHGDKSDICDPILDTKGYGNYTVVFRVPDAVPNADWTTSPEHACAVEAALDAGNKDTACFFSRNGIMQAASEHNIGMGKKLRGMI
eukprot:1157872-Pelagomonas_calceolata.AAC.6